MFNTGARQLSSGAPASGRASVTSVLDFADFFGRHVYAKKRHLGVFIYGFYLGW